MRLARALAGLSPAAEVSWFSDKGHRVSHVLFVSALTRSERVLTMRTTRGSHWSIRTSEKTIRPQFPFDIPARPGLFR